MTTHDQPTRPLAGRCALITGSSSGIGLAIAQSLAAQGADLMLNAIGDTGTLDQLCAGLAARHGVRVSGRIADVSNPQAVGSLVQAAHELAGRLDILVNNAGISHQDTIEDFPVDRWDALIAVHLSAAYHSIRAALPLMRAQGWGRIVNVASVYGLIASPRQAAYVAAKHGLIGLTKVVALEAARSDITCNAVCPGLVSTPRVVQGLANKAAESGVPLEAVTRAAMSTRQPSGAFIEAQDVAAMVAFLCGPHSAGVNGAAWPVDGAWTAQ